MATNPLAAVDSPRAPAANPSSGMFNPLAASDQV
jgi:hypothetical protein